MCTPAKARHTWGTKKKQKQKKQAANPSSIMKRTLVEVRNNIPSRILIRKARRTSTSSHLKMFPDVDSCAEVYV